jgi:hypothetical protein
VAQGVGPFSKLWPSFISADKEMDLFLYQYNRNISWLSNIRGASAVLNLKNITSNNSAGAIVIDFDKDFKEEVLDISSDRKNINVHRKYSSFHKITWLSEVVFSIHNITAAGVLTNGDWKISSFLVDDINNDEMNDLIVCIDIDSEDGSGEKTVIIKALQQGG